MAKKGPHWEYKSTTAACGLGGLSDRACYEEAVRSCAGNTPAEGRGPLTDVSRRWVDQAGKPIPAPDTGKTDWNVIGTTCLPELVPGAAPVPTIAMIVNAFHHTPWAKATITTQPKGDVTLVNLKTFYQANWAAQGFQPAEIDHIDPATMFGHQVDIRPRLVSYVYHYGDGTSSDPTTSPGGVYPDGDVTHTYTQRGTFTASVDVTFGADFRINGGDWIRLPDTVTVRQPGTTVTVKEARAVLVNQ